MASFPSFPAGGRTRSSEGGQASGQQQQQQQQEQQEQQEQQSTRDSSSSDLDGPETVVFSQSASLIEKTNENNTNASKTTGATETITSTPNGHTDMSDVEPRKCWICYMDETEDTPLNAEWRSPCPCALTAHEACLLDWLADLESPRSRKRNGREAKMLCPQCKAEIVVSRPRSYIVDVVRALERVAGRLVLPGMVFTLAGTVWAGCCAHGVYSMYFVFGADEARRIFEENADGPWSPGVNLGLPLIPLVLIFSRTRYAESMLPAIPVLFFAIQNPTHEPDFDLWPPTPAMTFAALPYMKSFYTALYDRFFGQLERKWIAEVQPRAGEAEPDPAAAAQQPLQQMDLGGDPAAAAAAQGDNGQILMEIDLELQVGLGPDDDEPPDIFGLPGAGNPHLPGLGALDGQNLAAGAGGNGQNGQILGRRQDQLIHETSNLADTILGALVFPAISASMGGLLKYILPKSWTTASSLSSSSSSSSSVLERSRPGLLQTRWGRTVIGGCAFVLLKDALVLYCRWKLAQTHRRRKILNYDRAKKQVSRS
ncbi:hypothetical protein ASPZODRAFT_127572 [Penicilliopsis zonata CBS 506.65]|uniref:RING-CH-type domain-containing protein n=1 Tax=Penicilliopsis zonata CBS 506.65 TaxID=1073090 RepID=A0A1L9SWG0_9EURO|nr:hypothetical protein ASPZODRAFT_127572 [Penicilliopsis zonata CBS 506.65]OJJ51494.1 hypothetical protein ASPZODRAFT_127572 [Penicilliopsis zonata CBS 506.65]